MNKSQLLENERQEVLAMAQKLSGEKRIKAYQLADRDDLAREYADELLVAEKDNYGIGPSAFSPYTPENWEVLRTKQIFDEQGIPYDLEAVKTGLMNTQIDVYCDERPSKDGIKSIDNILDNYGLNEEERMDFFVRMRERGKDACWADEVYRFCFSLKETGYSHLAAFTGISRKGVVAHYLDNLFFNNQMGVNFLVFQDDLSTKLWTLMQKEDVGGEEIASRAIEAVNKYKPKSESSRYDKAYRPYSLINKLSEIPTVKFPRDFVLKVLRNYVKSGGKLFEEYSGEFPAMLSFTDWQNDSPIRKLREESLRHEIESEPFCLLELVRYAVDNFKLNPQEGWLRKALNTHLNNWKDSTEEFKIKSAIYVGRNYGLLSQENIKTLEKKLKIVKLLKE
ncbi:MAG: hypothetical protein ABIB71_08270 [Candidatus Woesearchaeota archaeon]